MLTTMVPTRTQDESRTMALMQDAMLLAVAGVARLAGRCVGGAVEIDTSDNFERLLRIRSGQYPSASAALEALATEGMRDAWLAACAQLTGEGVPIDLTLTVHDGAGELRTLRVVLQLLDAHDVQNQGRGVVGAIHDEYAFHAGRASLASQERLNALGRLTLLGEVASGIAHELNQPLAAITTFAQAGERLLSLPEPRIERAREVFREVSQQSLRAGDIIRHMRSLIRRRAAQLETVEAQTLLQDFLQLAEPIAHASRVSLETQINVSSCQLQVDPTQLLQCLMVLFQNASEATRDAASQNIGTAAQVRVTAHTVEGGVEIAVQDRGPGISAEVAAQLYQPFFTTKTEGTGLGLISCRNILEAHRSHLQFENQPTGGCRFWFVLPCNPP